MINDKGLPQPRLHGVVPPLVTPLADRDELDVPGLERLLEHVLRGRVQGLFLLGTTGESTALSARLRRELISRVTRQVNGKATVLACVSDTSIVEALGLAEHAANAGAHAVVVSPPYYMPLDQSELFRYAKQFAAECPLPVFLYNMPRLTKVSFSIETVRQAMDLRNVVGLKDSSGDLRYLDDVCKATSDREDWSILVGSEDLIARGLTLGAHGCVPGGANIVPQLFSAAYDAAMAGDSRLLALAQEKISSLRELYQFGTPESGAIRGIKCALERLSICSGRLADPLEPCDSMGRRSVERILQTFELLTTNGLLTSNGFDALKGPHFADKSSYRSPELQPAARLESR